MRSYSFGRCVDVPAWMRSSSQRDTQLSFAAFAEQVEYAHLEDGILAGAAIFTKAGNAEVIAHIEPEIDVRDQVSCAENPVEIGGFKVIFQVFAISLIGHRLCAQQNA